MVSKSHDTQNQHQEAAVINDPLLGLIKTHQEEEEMCWTLKTEPTMI